MIIKLMPTIKQESKKHDSFYVYDQGGIQEAIQELQTNFPKITFLYSLKCNPHPHVVDTIFSRGVGADAASVAEVEMALKRNLSPQLIQYSAPGKTKEDIQKTIGQCTLTADSLQEIRWIEEVATQTNQEVEIGIRVHPRVGFGGGQPSPSKFGIDEGQLFQALPDLLQLKKVRIVGLHVHIKSQELCLDVLKRYYENLFQLAERLQTELGYPFSFLNMGSGIGIPYALTEQPLDVVALGAYTMELMEQYTSKFPQMQVYIETGRYLVGKNGIYVTKVVDKKESLGTIFVLLHNTLNGFLRPSLAQLVSRYNQEKEPVGTEPLFTGADAFPITAITSETRVETVTLVGNLCTGADVIASQIPMQRLNVGDVVVLSNAGSYAAVLSPMQFSSLTPPPQLFYTTKGEILL